MRSLTCALILALLIPAAVAAPAPADLDARRKALNDLLHEQWEYTMRTNPIYASILGDKRYNDKVDDFSQAAIDDSLVQARNFLARFEAIDTTGFPEQEILNQRLMVRDLKMTLEGARFKPWEMPVNQFSGIHIDAPQLVSVLAFVSVKDYEDYIARLKQIPRLFDQTIDQMRRGMAAGLIRQSYCSRKSSPRPTTLPLRLPSKILSLIHSINFPMPSPKPIASGCAPKVWPRLKIPSSLLM